MFSIVEFLEFQVIHLFKGFTYVPEYSCIFKISQQTQQDIRNTFFKKHCILIGAKYVFICESLALTKFKLSAIQILEYVEEKTHLLPQFMKYASHKRIN